MTDRWKVDGVDLLRVALVVDSIDDSVLVELIFTYLSMKFPVLRNMNIHYGFHKGLPNIALNLSDENTDLLV
jgi:hypothetical protein